MLKNKQLDVLFVSPNSAQDVYQELANKWTAIEMPFWACLLAESCRSLGYGVQILDCLAENLTPEQSVQRIKDANPRLVCFVTYGSNPNAGTTQMIGTLRVAQCLRDHYPEFKTLSIGSHSSALPHEVLNYECFDFVSYNEGVKCLHALLATDLETELEKVPALGWKDAGLNRLNSGVKSLVSTEEMDVLLPGYAWDLLPYKDKPFDLYRAHLWHALYQDKYRTPFASIYTSLGCKFKCLSGKTKINTIHGMISIEDLAKNYKTIPVYTYNQDNDEVVITDAINIRKTGVNKTLVRVHFDDDSYIDCTPDHKFLTFKNGNHAVETQFSEKEAKDLKEKDRVIALRHQISKYGYNIIGCRRKEYRNCRLVCEYKIGRKLSRKEQAHHKDRNKLNDLPENIKYCESAKDHIKEHPEIIERMKTNNPSKKMTSEWRAKLTASVTGKKRSLESRKRYSESKKGIKNPNYKHGKNSGTQTSRIKIDINHKVKYVETLSYTEDVYCMEVPGYSWFFANDVLVHNCDFCMINIVNRDDSNSNLYAGNFSDMRFWSPAHILKQFEILVEQYDCTTIRILDELFFFNKQYYQPILQGLIDKGYGELIRTWTYSRVDTVNERFLDLFQKAGVKYLALGIEAASQQIRLEITKGKFKDINIRDIVKKIQNHGLYTVNNFIFGHWGENQQDMQSTLDLALELNGEFSNFYAVQPLPGSELYYKYLERGWKPPQRFDAYSFHSYYTESVPTQHLAATEVLRFRDEAWHIANKHPAYQKMILEKFGPEALANIQEQTKIKLKRKILGD